MLADAVLAAALAGVAVFLLVGAVELEQLLVGLAEVVAVARPVPAAMVPRSCRLLSLIPSTADGLAGDLTGAAWPLGGPFQSWSILVAEE